MKKLLLLLLIYSYNQLNSQVFLQNCGPYSYSLNEPRYAHTMNVIEIGSEDILLITGGYDNGGALATAQFGEITINMNEAHADHTAEMLNDGRAIVIGGWNGSVNLTVIEAFDAETQEFSYIADMSAGRSFHKSIKLNDGRILITGGFDGSVNLASCEIFNPLTNEMQEAADMNFARSSHTINLLPNGKVLVTGGYNPDNGFQQTSCEIYDPVQNSWTNVAPLNVGRDNHASAIYDDKMVVSGGRIYNGELNIFEGQSTLELYDIVNDAWTLLTNTNAQPYSYHMLHGVQGYEINFITAGGIGNSGIDVEFTYSTMDAFVLGQPSEFVLASSINYVEQITPPGYLYASVLTTSLIWSGGLTSEGVSTDIFECPVAVESIPEIELPPLKIYPIPATDIATVEWGTNVDYVLNVYDLNGKLVATQKGRDSKAQVAELPSGNYIAHVTIGENTISGNLSFR